MQKFTLNLWAWLCLALQANGTLWASGDNTVGQLGDNTLLNRTTFVQEAAQGTTWLGVAPGDRHALARTSSGYQLASTGFNQYGQLGDNTTTTAVRYDHTAVVLPIVAATSVPAVLSLYPNPATGLALLSGAAPGATIRVLDAVGRLAATALADASGTALLDLPVGLYLVRVGPATVRLAVE